MTSLTNHTFLEFYKLIQNAMRLEKIMIILSRQHLNNISISKRTYRWQLTITFPNIFMGIFTPKLLIIIIETHKREYDLKKVLYQVAALTADMYQTWKYCKQSIETLGAFLSSSNAHNYHTVYYHNHCYTFYANDKKRHLTVEVASSKNVACYIWK